MSLHWQLHSFEQLKKEELYQLLRLRQEVFVVEQDCAYLDLDDLDQRQCIFSAGSTQGWWPMRVAWHQGNPSRKVRWAES